jgi:hypothetical protein
MSVFFHLNNSSCNKWFNFKIPSQSFYTIIPFLACSLASYLRPVVLEFYDVLAHGRTFSLLLDQFSQPFNYLPHFFPLTLHTQLGLPHPSIASILQCMCAHPVDLMGIHLLRFAFMATNALEAMI